MKAWEVREGTLSWSRLARPEPRPDQTLVEVAFSGVCGSDLAKITKSPIPTPGHTWRPGHEVVGWDLSTPSGPLVVVDPLVPCDSCANCATGAIHLCPGILRLGWDLPGGFAEFVVAPRRNVLPLPEGADPAQAVLADALAVAVHGIRCGLSNHRPGNLAVVGSGPLALCSAAYAASHGWSVTVLVRNAGKLAAVAEHIDATFTSLHEAPRNGFDAVVDAASGRDDRPLDAALSLVRDGGTVLVQNAYDPGVRLHHDLRNVFRRSITITGSFSYCRRHGTGDLPEALQVLAQRPAWADPLVGCRFPLRSLPSAVAAVTTGTGIRPIKAVLVAEAASPA
ncbi:alcohol dehydrogenase catalytic domain-containing protein [Streptomyces finlayi]|uniref:2-deoxy-scyllo-inosamine dehydrogenase n=1 Tax=Streptomyces finlayi TaxID=67296 RepID=A0A7G7BMH6_9ACTN|nr:MULTISPECIES: alcohol dehydrogenase catalytic domain-containing protein [Streptomyces]MCY0952815.1 alcohol dehydrogenase catalytic domain-containing protein [Streptomyces sp. H27-S2]QNE76541.1 alcohol dehydrogenase catalytic domain-containing protein [Streptomyces finlayi]